MFRMQEDEFDKIEISKEKCPPHDVVKLYFMGAHSDYGCLKCKRRSLLLTDFETKPDIKPDFNKQDDDKQGI